MHHSLPLVLTTGVSADSKSAQFFMCAHVMPLFRPCTCLVNKGLTYQEHFCSDAAAKAASAFRQGQNMTWCAGKGRAEGAAVFKAFCYAMGHDRLPQQPLSSHSTQVTHHNMHKLSLQSEAANGLPMLLWASIQTAVSKGASRRSSATHAAVAMSYVMFWMSDVAACYIGVYTSTPVNYSDQ